MSFDPFAMFRTAAPTPPAGPAPAPIPNPNPNANGQPIPGVDANNPTLPAGGGTPANGEAQDPFKDFAKLWDIDPSKVAVDTPFFANLDPAKVMESARKTSFANMTQEQMTAIASGGPEAVKMMQNILNSAAQNVYGQSAIASTKMIDQALEAQRKKFEEMLPTLITKHQVTSNLQTENPIFSNPALSPMVEGLKAQFIAKNPTATPAEIKQQITAYFNAVGMQFAPKPAVDPSAPKAAAETDWSKYMGDF